MSVPTFVFSGKYSFLFLNQRWLLSPFTPFQGSWNEFMWPVIVTTTREMFTLPVGMAFLKNEFSVQWPLLMAGTILISIPTLAIFLIFQRYFVQGVASAGLKE